MSTEPTTALSSLPSAPRRALTLPRLPHLGGPLAGAAVATLVLVVAVSFLSPLLFPGGYDEQDIVSRLAPPLTGGHLLGTDELGRDLLARIAYGGRIALSVSVIAAVLATALGTGLAIAAGLHPRTLDHVIGRLSDVQLSVPGIVLALVVLSFYGNGFVPLVTVLVLGSWVLTYRIVVDRVRAVAGAAFIEATRLTGVGRRAVVLRHLWPLVLPYVAVAFSLNFSTILVLESSLGFLGLGVQPPTPDWGQMIQTGLAKVSTQWWLAVLPGIPLVATIVSVQILGDRIAGGRVQKGQQP